MLAQASKTDLLALYLAILLDILLGTLEDYGALFLVCLLVQVSVSYTKIRASIARGQSDISDPKDGR